MHYRSVIYRGRAHLITNAEEKRDGLNCITNHYGAESHPLSEKEMQGVCVIRIDIAEIMGENMGAD